MVIVLPSDASAANPGIFMWWISFLVIACSQKHCGIQPAIGRLLPLEECVKGSSPAILSKISIFIFEPTSNLHPAPLVCNPPVRFWPPSGEHRRCSPISSVGRVVRPKD